jgi:LacI family transcriptional regulator
MDTVLVFTFSTRYQCRDRIDGITRYAEGRNWHVQTIERRAIKAPVARIVEFWKPLGIIAECGGGFPEISDGRMDQTPLVYIDENPACHRGKGVFVSSDSTAISTLAARELMSIGLRDFAFVGYPGSLFWSEERRKSFVKPLEQHGFAVAEFNHDSPFASVARRGALAKFLKGLPRPCGIFAANDPAAEEVLEVSTELGRSVPDDLAVIGVDDDEVICERSKPTLTSIRVDFEQAGYLAAEYLGSLIDGDLTTSAQVRYPPVCIIHRRSVPLPRRLVNGDPRAIRVQAFIRSEACGGIGVPDVVREMGCSRRLAEMVFRESIGCSIHEEITAVRLERACALLQSRSISAESVAHQCGWSSVSAFRDAFRGAKGVTVTEWRKHGLRNFD